LRGTRRAAGGGYEIRAARPFVANLGGLGRRTAGLAAFAPARKAKAGFNQETRLAGCVAVRGRLELPGALHAIVGKSLSG
jgi:hypothetical protein